MYENVIIQGHNLSNSGKNYQDKKPSNPCKCYPMRRPDEWSQKDELEEGAIEDGNDDLSQTRFFCK